MARGAQRLILALFFGFLVSAAFSDTAMAASCLYTEMGKTRFNSPNYEFCDGSDWISMNTGSGSFCTSPEGGILRYQGGIYEYCNTTNWIPAKGTQLAPCTAANAGKMVYSSTLMKFCDGSWWYAMTNTALYVDDMPNAFDFTNVAGAALSSIVNSNIVQITGIESALVTYSAPSGEFRVCNDSSCTSEVRTWGSASMYIGSGLYVQLRMAAPSLGGLSNPGVVQIGGLSDTWTVSTTATGWFVLSSANYASNSFGSLAGADAVCLADLTAQDFYGKATATLGSDNVKAFLCDDSTCNLLSPSTTYTYAAAGAPASGGGTFNATASSVGVGENATVWNAANRFNTNASIWTSRNSSSTSNFANTPTGSSCSNWTSTVGTVTYGTTSVANASRWAAGPQTCATSRRLICMVNVSDVTPTAFNFTDVTDAPRSQLAVSSILQITGIGTTTPVRISATSTAEYRICSDADCYSAVSGWTSSAGSIANGQYLQLRMLAHSQLNYSVKATVTVGTLSDDWSVSTSNLKGWFVMSQSTYNGNLGGLSGANATCLSQLQTYDFMNKSQAVLTSSNVRAFLCDSTGCNNLSRNTYYQFAVAQFPAWGGATMLTDQNGIGPNDTANWSGSTYFNATPGMWTGRDVTDTTHWAPYSGPTIDFCNDWTSSSSGQNGTVAAGSTTSSRWTQGNINCSNLRKYVCMVHPTTANDPTAFNFTDVTGAGGLALVTSNIVQITGITVTTNTSVSSNAEYRICTDSACSTVDTAWTAAAATLTNGKYVQMRMYAPASSLATAVGTLTVGQRADVWYVTTGTHDEIPNAVDFTDKTDALWNTQYASNVIQLTGFVSAYVNVSGASGSPEYRVCSDSSCTSEVYTWSSVVHPVSNNQYVQVRMTSANADGTRTATLTVGTTAITWDLSNDNSPAAFTITDSPNVLTRALAISPITQITSISQTGISITGAGTYEYRVCSDASCSAVVQTWTSAAGSIINNQYVQVRTLTSNASSTATNATLTVGTGSDTFTATTGTTETKIPLTSGTSWSVPGDWNNSKNAIECVGAGGRGSSPSGMAGGGGGGGGYAAVYNLTLSSSVAYSLGTGGSGGTANGTDTWFNSASVLNAAGGAGSTTNLGASGGTANTGDIVYSGGNGGAVSSSGAAGGGGAAAFGGNGGNGGGGSGSGGTGGGGAAGINGPGRSGGGNSSSGAGGGGGADGGANGNNGSSSTGGTGGANGTSGSGGNGGNVSAAGTAGTLGGGGGGGGSNAAAGAGGSSTDWNGSIGSGGGGGGGGAFNNGANGGLYGGGGGGGASGRTGGTGGNGMCVIRYIP